MEERRKKYVILKVQEMRFDYSWVKIRKKKKKDRQAPLWSNMTSTTLALTFVFRLTSFTGRWLSCQNNQKTVVDLILLVLTPNDVNSFMFYYFIKQKSIKMTQTLGQPRI